MRRSPRRAITTLAVLIAVVCAGCGIDRGEAYLRSFHAAQRAHSAGRYEDAAQLFAQAAGDARRLKDRDEAYFLEARMYTKLERWDDARARYRKLVEVSPNGPRTGRAVYEQAGLMIAHGPVEEGWTALEVAIRRYPNHGAARRALMRWVQHVADEHGEEAAQVALKRMSVELGSTALAQKIQYEWALSLRRAGSLAQAHALLLKVARKHPYPSGTLTDDAYWHASHIAEELGNYPQAVADLRELLSAREETEFGSYERPRYPAAQMRIAVLLRDRFNDINGAREEFRHMYQRHETSILADDALWSEAQLAKRQGDQEDACDLAEELAQRHPGSRYNRCLQQLCASARPADRPCPDYILNPRPPELSSP